MTTKPSNSIREKKLWRVGGARLSVFRAPTIDLAPPDWWAKTVGIEPESRTSKPKAGELLEQGPFAEGSLILSQRPERVDWQYAPVLQQDAVLGFPELGNLRAALDVFIPAMMKWLPDSPHALRLAFGASLFISVGSREEGYQAISDYMSSVKLDAKSSSDFVYQINRRRSSTSVDGLSINRLSRWHVASMARFQVQVSREKASAQTLPGEEFAAQTELDINTAPDFPRGLPHEVLPKILEELVALAVEISDRGDVA